MTDTQMLDLNDPALKQYADMLWSMGLPDIEVYRAVGFVSTYGWDVVPDGCMVFDTPTCGDWTCFNPHHQQLVANPEAVSS